MWSLPRLHLYPGRRLVKAEPEIKVECAEEAVGFHGNYLSIAAQTMSSRFLPHWPAEIIQADPLS
jgi:hypothetical protein